MSKFNYFVIFLKKINLSINSLLEKYLNKLNTINLLSIVRSNKVLVTFVMLIVLFLSYLSIPHAYNKDEIKREIVSQFSNKYGLDLIISKDFKYNFFPRPHFLIHNSSILEKQIEISKVKKLYIFVSLKNLFSLKDIVINNINLENANFNFNKKNYNFFIKFLDNDFSKSKFKIKDSNIFYRNIDNEVLFINKIIKMNYNYDPKELKNIIISDNEIFNVPYSFKLYKNKEKKIFSKIDLNFLNLQIENELSYKDDLKKGSTNLLYNKKKSLVNYEFSQNLFVFNYFEKIKNSNFSYRGTINLNPFFSNFVGKSDKIDLSFIFNANAFLAQLLKTEILNNKNLNVVLSVNSNKIQNYKSFVDISFNSKIEEGLIDIDNTKFSWKNYANFEMSDTLIYVKDNQLILDGKLIIDLVDLNEVYKFMLTPKKNRLELKKVELNINYNFDHKILNINDIKIDNQNNKKVGEVLKSLIFKNDNLQNKIYLKKIINSAIKSYVG